MKMPSLLLIPEGLVKQTGEHEGVYKAIGAQRGD